MLGKLLKHDLKSISRVLLPLNLVLVGITILGMVILSLTSFQQPETMLLGIGLLGTYIVMVVVLCSITHIYLMVFFYRSMFTHQGYLTFTLPATPWALLHSKGIAGFVWSLANLLLTYLSVALLISSAVGFSNFGPMVSRLFQENLIPAADSGAPAVITLEQILGVNLPQSLLFLAAITLLSCLYSVSTGYASVAIGQLYARHKVAGTVITYLIFYFIMQFFSGVVAVACTMRPLSQVMTADPETVNSVELLFSAMRQIYQPMLLALLGFQLLAGVVLYVVAGIIINKKVNLD